MKTDDTMTPFVPPVRLTPPDPVAAAAAAARAAFEEADRKAKLAASNREEALAALRSAERAETEETARRQKQAEEEAAAKSAAERAEPLRARANELAAGIAQALRWISGAMSERSHLNTQIGALYPGEWSYSHIRVLDEEALKTRGRFSTKFVISHD